jgi:hypothetical protein
VTRAAREADMGMCAVCVCVFACVSACPSVWVYIGHIAHSQEQKIRLMTFDNAAELVKVKETFPSAEVQAPSLV